MRVELAIKAKMWEFTIHPQEDELSGRSFLPRDAGEFRLVNTRFYLDGGTLPAEIHPDLLAGALWMMLHPVVGAELRLPLAVSPQFNQVLRHSFGVEVGPVDQSLAPPDVRFGGPALLLSGGLDSAAAALILPDDVRLIFQDRIPRAVAGAVPSALVHLAQQRKLAQTLAGMGREVHRHRDGHEQLFEPYPSPNTNMTLIAPLLRAEALGLTLMEYGAVLADLYFEGYTLAEVGGWRFRKESRRGQQGEGRPKARFVTRSGMNFEEALTGLLSLFGMRSGATSAGMSEVATALAVHRSPLRGLTYSCHQRSLHTACLACDKCFRKLLLQHIFDDQDVPDDLVDYYLSRPSLAGLFSRRFMDFHHVWMYVFQRVKSGHPVLAKLQHWAQDAPDLGFLAKWYVRHEHEVVPIEYRAEVATNVRKYLEPMSQGEQAILESLELPPLSDGVRRGGGL